MSSFLVLLLAPFFTIFKSLLSQSKSNNHGSSLNSNKYNLARFWINNKRLNNYFFWSLNLQASLADFSSSFLSIYCESSNAFSQFSMYLSQFWLIGKYIVLISSMPARVTGSGNLFKQNKSKLEYYIKYRAIYNKFIRLIFPKFSDSKIILSEFAPKIKKYKIQDLIKFQVFDEFNQLTLELRNED